MKYWDLIFVFIPRGNSRLQSCCSQSLKTLFGPDVCLWFIWRTGLSWLIRVICELNAPRVSGEQQTAIVVRKRWSWVYCCLRAWFLLCVVVELLNYFSLVKAVIFVNKAGFICHNKWFWCVRHVRVSWEPSRLFPKVLLLRPQRWHLQQVMPHSVWSNPLHLPTWWCAEDFLYIFTRLGGNIQLFILYLANFGTRGWWFTGSTEHRSFHDHCGKNTFSGKAIETTLDFLRCLCLVHFTSLQLTRHKMSHRLSCNCPFTSCLICHRFIHGWLPACRNVARNSVFCRLNVTFQVCILHACLIRFLSHKNRIHPWVLQNPEFFWQWRIRLQCSCHEKNYFSVSRPSTLHSHNSVTSVTFSTVNDETCHTDMSPYAGTCNRVVKYVNVP